MRTWQFAIPSFVLGLDADGSRLVLYRLSGTHNEVFTLVTLDTASGATLGTVTLPNAGGDWPHLTPDLRTAYRLDTHPGGAWPNVTNGGTTLTLVDLMSGAQRSVPLPMVRAGTFPQERTIGGEAVPLILNPGLAVSADSTRLYIAHADADAVTVVNLPRGIVERTETIKSKQSVIARVFGWLAPQRVAAKYMEGANKAAALSPDGHTLAITGETISLRGDGQSYDINDRGVQLVDLRTFTETSHTMQRAYQGYADSMKAQWSADGAHLYLGHTTAAQTPDGANDAYELQIMDACTHAITATQTYTADTDTDRGMLQTWFAIPSNEQ